MSTEFIWQNHDAPGWEHVRVLTDHPGWTVFDSILVKEHNDQVLRGGYTLVMDKQWRTLELRLMVETAPGAMEGIHLMSEGDGRWTDADENHMPELDGCMDVDIQWSPLSNSLPLNRLNSAEGEGASIRVAYVSLPDLTVKPVDHHYKRLSASQIECAFLPGDDAITIDVDADGIVTRYPGFFSRTWPQ